jgi:hypothetical protein
MNIARLRKADERSYLFKSVTGSSPVWQVPKHHGPENAFLRRLPRVFTAPPYTKDHEEKFLTQDLFWVDMIVNALIVIAIASASYFFISAKVLQIIEPAISPYSERSPSR